jgi:response regulator RpfG family c-di-GMP phosphodiesterase
MNIIILDDSQTVRIIIEAFLEDFGVEESEIFSFSNGYEAFEFIKKNKVDIIFSDINMPDMDGYEFAQKVFEFMPDIKSSFFVISGDEAPEGYSKMKEIGVHRFLKKPINDAHFKHFVKPEILKRRK